MHRLILIDLPSKRTRRPLPPTLIFGDVTNIRRNSIVRRIAITGTDKAAQRVPISYAPIRTTVARDRAIAYQVRLIHL